MKYFKKIEEIIIKKIAQVVEMTEHDRKKMSLQFQLSLKDSINART
jgi:hypothetical protein